MNKEIAKLLKNKLIGISFFEVIGGLAQAVTLTKFNEDDNVKLVKKMPVTYDMASGKNGFLGSEQQLVPNQSKKSIIYFEDFGTVSDTKGNAGSFSFISQIRIVCWMNKDKIGVGKYDDITGKCIDEILNRLIKGQCFNGGGITRLFVSNPRIAIQDANIFSRYNYDEAETQYLRPPFEYFAIDLTCKYQMRSMICGGADYSTMTGMRIRILIKAVPDPSQTQTLYNGWVVPLEYPPGNTLQIKWLKYYSILAPMVIDHANVDPIPYDSNTATWDFTTTDITTLIDGNEIFINAFLPKGIN